jgi:quercetin dioxygenase-like cupin family protein
MSKRKRMARAGGTVENPVTKERIVWRRTARDTHGELLQFDLHLQPGAAVAAAHIHPSQEERFVVQSGAIRVTVAGQVRHLSAGEEAVVPPGTAHAWSNEGGDPAHVIVDLRPALDTETFFETFFGLARDGKTHPATGLPTNLLQLAVLVDAFRRELTPAPAWQRAVLVPLMTALAMLGRRCGYKSRYPAYSE